MQGLYRGANENTFVSDDQIIREAQIRTTTPQFLDYQPNLPDWHYWNSRFNQKAQEYRETEEQLQNSVEIQLPDRPARINLISDIHVGGPHTDYSRIEQEVETILRTPDSYVFLLGDEADTFFWAETAINDTIEQIPQQYYWYREFIRYVSDNNRLLGVWEGNHTAWTRKVGRSFQSMLQEVTNAPLFSGIGYVTLNVGNTQYRIVGSHQYPGNSQFNNCHPEERAIRFGSAWGADIVVGGHTHKKQITQKPFQSFNDETQIVTQVSLGAYKTHDSYGNRLGFSRFTPKSMYGVTLLLDNEEKDVQTFYDILKGNEN